ncbi:DUF397 domain-containing protein [Actinopolyspora erythraea]|uniref:DUF397 domain-containing protein n=2 Tax=Actinopolyspora TaxID=1849 RepID=A0A099D7A7_9ACTN|nr:MULTISPECIES: DUF397 domain-containing protein [Actinopolyspora]ASU78935.1 DUF397 domain-containing protein [Actinopolyspora erythraea]KGI81275.1 hypothetical protein IL38_12375 [Actinopolyspora erythraea]SDP35940.1 protein of unknown function [Actinopolyspora xinjiangensis]
MADLTGVTWRKSSRSQGADNCVEVAVTSDNVGVRDSKDREAGFFTATGSQWSAFLDAVKTSRFD